MEALITAFRTKSTPTFPTSILCIQRRLQIVRQLFSQQQQVGPDSILWGLIAWNWMVAHNVCSNTNNVYHRDPKWIKNMLWALFDFILQIWKDRCSAINDFSKENPLSMQSSDLMKSIQNYTDIPKNEVSVVEKALHTNISRTKEKAHQRTLAGWRILLCSEREATIKRKRENRTKNMYIYVNIPLRRMISRGSHQIYL